MQEKDSALMGSCVSCGAACYAQSYCDDCSDVPIDEDKSIESCTTCAARLSEGDIVFELRASWLTAEGELELDPQRVDSYGICCYSCGLNLSTKMEDI